MTGGGPYYNVHRWFEPTAARYTKIDPLGLLAGMNLFGYGRSKPTLFTDPLGLTPKPQEGKWCDERSPNFDLCDCSKKTALSALDETLSLRRQFCDGRGVSNRSRTKDPVASGDYSVAGSLDNGRPWYDPSVIGDDPCLHACTCVHEENHAAALADPRLADLFHDELPTELIADWLECMAYSDEAVCLSGFIGNI